MKFTTNQLTAIESRGKDLLISASAGTGKTAVLIERVYRLIAEDGIDISRMLVVTYTEKAARELKSRLAAKLSSAIEDKPSKARLLEEQLEKIEWADISTIHSFCKKVAVQNFSISKIDPSARVLDEAERKILLHEAIQSVIREELNKAEPEAALLAYVELTDTKKLRNLLFDLYLRAAGYDEPLTFFQRAREKSGGRELSSSLLNLALRMTRKYKETKAEHKLMDFDDMQYYALSALDDEAVRESYRQAYDHIFVDEYQDTSYVQDRLIGQIARQGSLFIVGDYKQSIYGFRNARPELFLQKYDSYKDEEAAECIRLNENFRSEIQVVDAVNEVFTEIMTRDFGGLDYEAEARLVFPNKEDGPVVLTSELGPDKRTRINFIDTGRRASDEEEDYGDDHAYYCLISRIKEISATYGYSYDDICVLMRSPNQDARKIKRLFEEEGLGLSIDIEDDVLRYPELRTLMDYLKLLVYPFDDEALLAVLRSPIGRMNDDELFLLSQVKRELKLAYYADFFEYIESESLPGSDPDSVIGLELKYKLKAFYEKMEAFRRDENLLIRDRLQRVIDESDYLHYLLGRSGKEHLRSSLYEFLDYIYEFEKTYGSNLYLFVEGYEDLVLSDNNVKARPTPKRAEKSVKLLSIHKSKGLQFKVVILFGCEKDFMRTKPQAIQYKDYAFDEEGGLLLNLIERDKGVDRLNPLIEEARLRQKSNERLEEQRLFYVALTRAEVKLELMIKGREGDFKKKIAEFKGYEPPAEEEPGGRQKKSGKSGGKSRDKEVVDFRTAKSYADWLICALDFKAVYDFDFAEANKPLVFGNNWEFCVLTPQPEGSEEGLTGSETAEGDYIEEAKTASEPDLRKFREFSYPSAQLPVRRSVTSLKKAYSKEDFDYFEGPVSKDATKRGTLYHSFMQHMIGSARSVEDFLILNRKRGFISEEDLTLIDLEKIRLFTEHPVFERIHQAGRVWKEKPFIYQTKIDGKPLQIQGIIDLMFLEKKEVVIIDYKSDRLKKREDFVDLYKSQLDIYAEAISSITDLSVKEKLIYSFELGELIEV